MLAGARNQCRRSPTWGCVFALVLVTLASGSALAGPREDRYPPKTRLITGLGLAQSGYLYRQDWTAASGRDSSGHRVCSTLSGDALAEFPEPLAVGPATKRVWVALRKRQRPSDVFVSTWADAENAGTSAGMTEVQDVRITRRVRGGRTRSWRAAFEVDPMTQGYIMVTGVWHDRRCQTTENGSWLFRVAPH